MTRATSALAFGSGDPGRSGIHDMSILRGEMLIAEFRGRSRVIRGVEEGR